MRKYLSELPTKPDHHKKHFALAISSITTLFIFGIWSFVTLNVVTSDTSDDSKAAVLEVSPLESIKGNVTDSARDIRDQAVEIRNNVFRYGQ